ncbi:sugar ABC transporter substrate-binding protein [Stigmatella aurantiaca]|uniref:RbsB protein n=1 Tax=Stigmatella aurantiaca (strain DW4/3-1) TaxID=378806 RepID=Q08VN8_STIAD|nr:sugar ABC transporter substrate-binding protein [Stigmatella aurantiaca]ADO73836.1 Transcriptional regulator, periplasmic binding protein of LacI family protein [Stigmatella aurantiaca DW4/3-1]EAU64557.1 RbsB protein [Stigmatella aurantiaca DW4/3-1]
MRFLRWLCVLAWASAFMACSDSPRPTVPDVVASVSSRTQREPDAAPNARKIALVMKTLTNPFFIEMEKGARRAQKELGIDLLVKTAAQETSIEQQIQIIEDLIRMKFDAIVIAPGDSLRLVPVLKAAQEAGIRIINIDNRLDAEAMKGQGMAPVPFISVDNEKAAYESAGFIAREIHKPAQAAILEGIRSADNSRQRRVGAERAFRENPLIRLVARESANWKIDEGRDVTRRLFSDHPDITLLFCANDMMALGAIQFLQESGRYGVKVAAYDALEEAKRAILSGRMEVTVNQQAAEQGYQGIILASRVLNGEAVPEVVLVETSLVTLESLK